MMLKRMLGPMVMERARRGWMLTSSVKYKFIWTTVNPNCVENSIPKFQTAGSNVPLLCWLSLPNLEFFCDCPRPDINKSLISIGVFNFWALLFQTLLENSSQDGFPKQTWGQDRGWRGCDSGDGGQVLSRNWLQVERPIYALTGRGEKGWRHWQLRPSTWPRIPTL